MLGQFKRFEIARKLPGEHIKCQYCDKDLETYVWLLQPYQIRLCQKCTQKLSPVVFVENNEEISELAQSEKDQEIRMETDIPQHKYKCDLCQYTTKESTDVIWHHLECHFEK